MLDRVFPYFDLLFHMNPILSVALMIAGVLTFVVGSKMSTGTKQMTGGQTAIMIAGVALFFLGLFPIIGDLPRYIPALR
ncbi:MAG: hypothetical protein U0166_29705 [Acidobacteriota bacterium]